LNAVLNFVKASLHLNATLNLSMQAIAQVRTVQSFVGEARFVKAYSDALQKTTKLAGRGCLAKGLGMGCSYATTFSCWSLLLWYGGVLVRKGEVDGGQALSTIFAVFLGSL
jgi:ATP-binding cassette subfamily B (MDR/TAP) protein 1